MKIGSQLTYKTAADALIRMEIEKIEHFREQVGKHNLADSKYYEQEYENISRSNFLSDFDYHSYLDTFDDRFYDLSEINKLAEQLVIVALYRLVELKTKSILHVFIKDTNKVYKSYRWDKLEKTIKNDFGFDLSNVSFFENIDELRLLNNSIKHKGTVIKDLEKYNGWTEGDEIKDLHHKINKFGKVIPKYFSDLIDKLNNGLKLKTK